uniref:Uncharacterized protein n=1 Tax=Oryza punctata TaxID=4537 RepID=A0A0E0JZB0_ORYPU
MSTSLAEKLCTEDISKRSLQRALREAYHHTRQHSSWLQNETLNPPTAKQRRSPIVLPIVRSPGVRQIISQNVIIMERSQAAGKRSRSAESPRARSLSLVARLASSPYAIPIELDVETQPRESSQSTPHVVTHCSGKRTLTSLICK